MQKVSNIIPYFIKELSHLSANREVVNWGYLSIEHVLGYSRSDCILHANKSIDVKVSNKLSFIVSSLKNKKPLQYILGVTDFYGLKIKVDSNTLIPRPETEELVDWILKENFNSVLDIGTGSGCIAIALAKYANVDVCAIDLSECALDVAKENAIFNNVKVKFAQQDIFKTELFNKVDLIVSNPPYVLDSEKDKIDDNVLRYEPHLALFVSDHEPLVFYKKIISIATISLNSKGKLFFEINEKFANQLINILIKYGFVDIELKKDINERPRMIKAIWK
tara:strand:+ start:1912 stop:2745 length:834 start_codon:yes stop_codon:yes gene_type:complete